MRKQKKNQKEFQSNITWDISLGGEMVWGEFKYGEIDVKSAVLWVFKKSFQRDDESYWWRIVSLKYKRNKSKGGPTATAVWK